jgi:hypothetical protein
MVTYRERITDEAWKTALAATVIGLHTSIVCLIIFCTWLVENLILVLWRGEEPLIAGIPLHMWLLYADLFLLIAFVVGASLSAAATIWRR